MRSENHNPKESSFTPPLPGNYRYSPISLGDTRTTFTAQRSCRPSSETKMARHVVYFPHGVTCVLTARGFQNCILLYNADIDRPSQPEFLRACLTLDRGAR